MNPISRAKNKPTGTLTSSSGMPIPPCAINLSSSSSYSSSNGYSPSCSSPAPLLSCELSMSVSGMSEYPPLVSVFSASPAELPCFGGVVSASPTSRLDELRWGVARSSEPEPGCWTAAERTPAVCEESAPLFAQRSEVVDSPRHLAQRLASRAQQQHPSPSLALTRRDPWPPRHSGPLRAWTLPDLILPPRPQSHSASLRPLPFHS